jgi:signal transduction histidine kinase
LLFEVNEVDYQTLKIFDRTTIQALLQEKVVIYDEDNNELYNSIDNDTLNIDWGTINRIRQEREISYEENEREIVGLVYQDAGKDMVVIASAYDKYGRSKLKNLQWVLVWGNAISLFAVGLAGWFFSNRALKPISKVVKEVENINAKSFSARLDVGAGKDEISQLAETFNEMLDRLEAAFEMQKGFISAASHELRTPLTSMSGEIEVALLKNRGEKEYQVILHSMLEEVKRLTRLTNGLLNLAQADMDVAKMRLEAIRVDELLWECEVQIRRSNPNYIVRIDFDLNAIQNDTSFDILCNRSLIQTAFYNVIENGCKYSPNHTVDIVISSVSNNIIVNFIDKGIGIRQEDFEHIFEPFYRSKETSGVQGFGIGLPLTKRIIDMHNGQIQITSQPNKGTLVRIEFASYRG